MLAHVADQTKPNAANRSRLQPEKTALSFVSLRCWVPIRMRS